MKHSNSPGAFKKHSTLFRKLKTEAQKQGPVRLAFGQPWRSLRPNFFPLVREVSTVESSFSSLKEEELSLYENERKWQRKQ